MRSHTAFGLVSFALPALVPLLEEVTEDTDAESHLEVRRGGTGVAPATGLTEIVCDASRPSTPRRVPEDFAFVLCMSLLMPMCLALVVCEIGEVVKVNVGGR